MRAGELDRLIEIQHRVLRRGAAGGEDVAWQVFARAYARIDDAGGSEAFQGKQLVSTSSRRFTIRFIPGLTPAMRIFYAGQVYLITRLAEGAGRGRELIIEAEIEDGASKTGGGV